jgi:hypothetical protein
MKKIYVKPNVCSVDETVALVPVAPIVALVGAYALGRGVKQAMEARPEQYSSRLVSVME